MKWLMRASLALAMAWYSLTAALPAKPQEPEEPLPDLQSFLSSVRSKLKTDNRILSSYTYRSKSTERRLDRNGQTTKTEVKIYDVFHDREPDTTYRRLIEEDGKPVSAAEIEKQDRNYEKERSKATRKLSKDPVKAAAQKQREEREEQEAIDEAFALYDITMEAREWVNGRPAIRFSFRPRPGFKARTDAGKMLAKMSGQAWFDEETQEMARINVETLQDISVGFGILGKLRKGARASFERRYLNNEAWLPASAQFAGALRIMLFKGMRLELTNEFWDYKKFTVETSVSYAASPKNEGQQGQQGLQGQQEP